MDYRFSVIGYGHIGKKHAQVISRLSNAKLLAVCDSQIIRQEELQSEHPEVHFYTSWSELLQQETETEIVSICLPNGLHAEAAIACLEAGKHVLIEKPMCLSKEEGEAILQAAERANRHVWVVKQNRYSPPSQWMKQTIDSGKMGKILQIQVNCFWNRDNRYYKSGIKNEHNWRGSNQWDGGILYTQFSHFIDLLFWVFHEIETLYSCFENQNHRQLTEFADQGTVVFKTRDGALGTLNVSINAWNQNMESSIVVLGEKGSFKIGGQYMDKIEYCQIEGVKTPQLAPSPEPNNYGPYSGSASNHAAVYFHLMQHLQGHAHESTSAKEALKVVSWIESLGGEN
ncbi:O-antigen biosynthesis protein WlbA [Bacteroidota bacterium]